jgi:hypothetical protein
VVATGAKPSPVLQETSGTLSCHRWSPLNPCQDPRMSEHEHRYPDMTREMTATNGARVDAEDHTGGPG